MAWRKGDGTAESQLKKPLEGAQRPQQSGLCHMRAKPSETADPSEPLERCGLYFAGSMELDWMLLQAFMAREVTRATEHCWRRARGAVHTVEGIGVRRGRSKRVARWGKGGAGLFNEQEVCLTAFN
eukprot:892939-Pleurochrysis_carterae.AAC.1